MLSAFGFGSLYTLHDVYTSDPLMFVIGPFSANALLTGRTAVAATVARRGRRLRERIRRGAALLARGILRRWSGAGTDARRERWPPPTRRSSSWLALTMTLMLRVQLTVLLEAPPRTWRRREPGGWLPSSEPARNRFRDVHRIRCVVAARAGRVSLLAPRRCGCSRSFRCRSPRCSPTCSSPIARCGTCTSWSCRSPRWCSIAPPAMGAAIIGAFAVGNLRVGAQLPIAPVARVAIAASLLLAGAAIFTAARAGRRDSSPSPLPAGVRP